LRQLLESPDDPDLRRLFPPAYAGTGDEEVAAEADYRDAMGSALVEVHIVGAVLVWAAVLRFHLSLTGRMAADPVPVSGDAADGKQPEMAGV
ncbi:MAG TPA: hypothetical protein VFH45_00555, partial [Acidimicrobiales bacterium]|nr:hypothetical protein [Acidimicrobiales bacterium]